MYKVRFVNPQKHFEIYRSEFMGVLEDRLARGEMVFRQDLLDFEEGFAKLVGTKYALGLNSGFDALHLSLRAAGIGKDDEVITVAHTFLATISAIVLTGAKPVLIDIGSDWNMDTSKIEEAITEKTKAIIPVHLNGRMTNMSAVMEIAKKHNLFVIEDACQSLSATQSGKSAGAIGDVGCFSFYPFKIFGCFGEGGAITTNNEELYNKVKLLRYHGIDRDPARTPITFGYNAILDNIQAAVLNVKLKHFPKWIQRRQKIAEIYRNGLSDIEGLKLPHFPDSGYVEDPEHNRGTEDSEHNRGTEDPEHNRGTDVYQNYVIQTPRRDELKSHLEENGVETIVSWPKPIYTYPTLSPTLGSPNLPETEKVSKEVISLPLYPELENSEVEYVITSIKTFFEPSSPHGTDGS